jgi:putative oxidoreductase
VSRPAPPARDFSLERHMNLSIIPPRYAPHLHALLRIVAGLLFLEHGTGKIFNFPPIHEQMLKILGSGLFYFTGLVELVGGLLILVGFVTRPVAFVLSGFMAFAYFMAHFPRGFFPLANMGEPAILFCFVFLYLAAAGAGPFSVDAALGANAGARSSSSRGAAAA